jgi:geranylgeranyl diphosphate synthase type I
MPLEGMFRCKEISENEIKGLKKLINVMGLVYQMINDYQNILKSKTDIKLNHMNFVNIITKAKNKDQKKMSHEIMMEAKKMINKKLQMIEKYIHNIPIIVQPIFMNIAKSMKEGL